MTSKKENNIPRQIPKSLLEEYKIKYGETNEKYIRLLNERSLCDFFYKWVFQILEVSIFPYCCKINNEIYLPFSIFWNKDKTIFYPISKAWEIFLLGKIK